MQHSINTFFVGQKVTAHDSNSDGTLLLADDIETLWNSSIFQSGNARGRHITIVLDNCGLELCTDLVLAEMLLISGIAATITLYAKEHPIFVSDALPSDVHHHIAQVFSLFFTIFTIHHSSLMVQHLFYFLFFAIHSHILLLFCCCWHS